jgi:hypothetical protein
VISSLPRSASKASVGGIVGSTGGDAIRAGVVSIVPWCDSEEIVVALLWLMSEGRVALEQFNTCRSSNQAGGELTPHSLVYRHNRDQTALAYPPQPTTSPMKTRGSNATAAAEPQPRVVPQPQAAPQLRHSPELRRVPRTQCPFPYPMAGQLR